MIEYSQSLEINGLTVTLSVSADFAALSKLFEGSEGEVSSEELEEIFLTTLQETPKTLLTARDAICLSLFEARISSLRKSVL